MLDGNFSLPLIKQVTSNGIRLPTMTLLGSTILILVFNPPDLLLQVPVSQLNLVQVANNKANQHDSNHNQYYLIAFLAIISSPMPLSLEYCWARRK